MAEFAGLGKDKGGSLVVNQDFGLGGNIAEIQYLTQAVISEKIDNQTYLDELKRRGAKRIGLVGPLTAPKVRALEEHFKVVFLDGDYVRLRLIKSEEEIDWLCVGAAFSDLGLEALLKETKPGMTELELGNVVERAYVGQGGTTFIHYIGVTSMADPHICVPPQFASSRKVKAGDVVFCELSAYWWDYPGQVLRIP